MTHSFGWYFLMLCAGHALCDYPLQGDFLARAKNHKAPIAGVPWWQALLAHVLIHGAMVTLITGDIRFGIAECVIHFVVDWAKCDGLIDFDVDQTIHYLFKLAWAVLAWGMQ